MGSIEWWLIGVYAGADPDPAQIRGGTVVRSCSMAHAAQEAHILGLLPVEVTRGCASGSLLPGGPPYGLAYRPLTPNEARTLLPGPGFDGEGRPQ